MLAYCARQGLPPHDAADATADIFLAAMGSRYRFDASLGESATPWLYSIASNILKGRHRRSTRERAAHQRLYDQPIELTERDVAEYAELKADVQRALALIQDLPAPQRAAVLARHLEDADYVELAEREGVSEAVVRQRVSRALTTLRSRMTGGGS